jgi:DNA-binding NarL/FixJ family response regulator
MTESRPRRLLVADDHAPTLEHLADRLRRAGFDVVAECADGRLAIEAAATTAPDVCLLDVSMPETSGIETALVIGRRHPAVGLVLMTASPNERDLAAALCAGVHGYLGKDVGPDGVAAALHAVCAGETSFPDRLMRRVLSIQPGA